MEPDDPTPPDDAACDRILAALDAYARKIEGGRLGLPRNYASCAAMRGLIREALNPPADPLLKKTRAFVDHLNAVLAKPFDSADRDLAAERAHLARQLADLVRSAKP